MTIWPILIIFNLLLGAFIAYAIISTKKAKAKETDTWLMRFWETDKVKTVTSSPYVTLYVGFVLIKPSVLTLVV